MVRFAAFSCLHAPITDPKYFAWLIKQLEEFKPAHVVNLGDWYEGKAAKRWPSWSDEKWSLEDEHRAVYRQAQALNDACPDAQFYWLYGNHDDNLFGIQPDRIADDLKDSVQWDRRADLSEELALWKVVRKYNHREKLRLGPVTFQHGCAANVSAEKDSSYLYGTPYGLYIQGHTHRPVRVTRAEERQKFLPFWYANPGCGADWGRMHYMDRMSMAKWGRGLIVGEIPESSIRESRTAYASKNWDAELRIHSMAHD